VNHFQTRPRALLIFVDGFGIGANDTDRNPVLTYGGSLLDPDRTSATVGVLDAALGVDGRPQSATGQTTLFTGENAPALVGRHVTGYPTQPLRELLMERSFLKRAAEAGLSADFVNAFRPLFFTLPRAVQERMSASTLAHLASGRRFMDLDDVSNGAALYQDMTNGHLIDRGFDVPRRTPEQAGRVLARTVVERDLTLYEYFRSDKAGHTGERSLCEEELRRVDGLVAACLDELDVLGEADATSVLLTSDHGNIEDLSVRTHTHNPVPLLAWGAGADAMVSGAEDLSDVAPRLLAHVGVIEQRS
jgi:2,3-bisphosphoglycerate-independent phosphoglycerate mutase